MESAQKTVIKGDLSTLIRISLPLILFLFCEALTAFVERVFLSRHSPEAVSSSLNGTYLAFIFNNPCIGIASMAQVFTGLYQGSGELKRIGSCIWQLIWFSLLSLIVTLPLSFWASSIYFKGTSIEHMGKEYFNILAWSNFLFPLSTALMAFYLGRGKTAIVTLMMLTSYAVNLALSWILILGVEGSIPALGVQGAALAKCLSLGLFCLAMLCFFLKKKNREIYETGEWHFLPTQLWSYMKPGLVRAFGYFWSRAGWAAISHLMMKKGGLYLDIQTVGGTMITFLIFIPSGIYRTVLAIAPNLLGAKDYAEIWRLCRSLMIYISLIAALIAIPLLLFPRVFIVFFDPSSQELFDRTFKMVNHWVWLYITAISVQIGLCGLIVAARDLRIQFYMYLFSYLTSLLPVYILIYRGNWEPDKLWLIMGIENVIFALLFFYRFYKRKWEEEQTSAA